MTTVLFADYDYPDIELERAMFSDAGLDMVTAQCKTEEQVILHGGGCRAILLQYAPVSERVLSALPEIAIISRIGAGYDTIDTEGCRRRGVWLANSPDYGVGEVATHALALALASIRNVVAYHRDIGKGDWNFLSSRPLRRPSELTLGIVGLGRIGKRMAHVSRNLFKRVIAYDPYLIDGDFPPYVERIDALHALASQSDIVSLHTPLTDETRGFIDAGFFGAAKRGVTLINTSRGAVVDLEALIAALDAEIVVGAGLDVLPVEPIPRGSPLISHPRVILTPHAAFFSVEAERELRRKAAQNIVSWARSGRPDYPVVVGTQ
jgi:phosphoglycerate dehydrogenase-like enzyme